MGDGIPSTTNWSCRSRTGPPASGSSRGSRRSRTGSRRRRRAASSPVGPVALGLDPGSGLEPDLGFARLARPELDHTAAEVGIRARAAVPVGKLSKQHESADGPGGDARASRLVRYDRLEVRQVSGGIMARHDLGCHAFGNTRIDARPTVDGPTQERAT